MFNAAKTERNPQKRKTKRLINCHRKVLLLPWLKEFDLQI